MIRNAIVLQRTVMLLGGCRTQRWRLGFNELQRTAILRDGRHAQLWGSILFYFRDRRSETHKNDRNQKNE